MRKLLIIFFILLFQSIKSCEIKRELYIICNPDPNITLQEAYLKLMWNWQVIYKDKDYYITKPYTNGVVNERYYILILERNYFK